MSSKESPQRFRSLLLTNSHKSCPWSAERGVGLERPTLQTQWNTVKKKRVLFTGKCRWWSPKCPWLFTHLSVLLFSVKGCVIPWAASVYKSWSVQISSHDSSWAKSPSACLFPTVFFLTRMNCPTERKLCCDACYVWKLLTANRLTDKCVAWVIVILVFVSPLQTSRLHRRSAQR